MTLVLVLGFVMPTYATATADTTLEGSFFSKITKVGNKTFGAEATGELKVTPGKLVANLLGTMLGFLGVIFLILAVYGGWLWMTAQGNEEQSGKARKLILDAVIGLLVVTAAYIIVFYVSKYVFEATGLAPITSGGTNPIPEAPTP